MGGLVSSLRVEVKMQPSPPVSTPYLAPPAAPQLATRFSRLNAQMVDAGLTFVACLPSLLIFVLATPDVLWLDAPSGTPPTSAEIALVLSLLVPLVFLVYNTVYLVARTGQTMGKRGAGIRIVRTSGAPVGFFDGVVLRGWVVQTIGAVIGLVNLVDVLMIYNKDRRCLHDYIAGTIVIEAS